MRNVWTIQFEWDFVRFEWTDVQARSYVRGARGWAPPDFCQPHQEKFGTGRDFIIWFLLIFTILGEKNSARKLAAFITYKYTLSTLIFFQPIWKKSVSTESQSKQNQFLFLFVALYSISIARERSKDERKNVANRLRNVCLLLPIRAELSCFKPNVPTCLFVASIEMMKAGFTFYFIINVFFI